VVIAGAGISVSAGSMSLLSRRSSILFTGIANPSSSSRLPFFNRPICDSTRTA
jgi:hypothetical protein